MKCCYFLLSFTLSIMLFGCKNTSTNNNSLSSPQNSKKVELQLVDSLGTVTLFVPLRYDTSFSWLHESDCGKPCDEQQYRFQPKELPITKESGSIWMGEPKDSIERFTISHRMYFPFHDGDTAKNMIRHNHLKEELVADTKKTVIVFDTIQKINDRYYSIIAMEKFDTIYSKKVLAATTIKNNVIRFQFELVTKKKDSIATNFIKNSIELLKTIYISKGI